MAQKEDKSPSLEAMADFAVKSVLRALGKGSDLHSEMIGVIMHAAAWGADNRDRHLATLKSEKTRRRALR